jgi:hypothetical protein
MHHLLEMAGAEIKTLSWDIESQRVAAGVNKSSKQIVDWQVAYHIAQWASLAIEPCIRQGHSYCRG